VKYTERAKNVRHVEINATNHGNSATMATSLGETARHNVVSNQYLFDRTSSHTCHIRSSRTTPSAGPPWGAPSYLWNAPASSPMITAAAAQPALPNTIRVPSYTQVNLGVSTTSCAGSKQAKPCAFDVVTCSTPHIRDPGRLGHRPVRPAVRAAERVFRGSIEEAVSVHDAVAAMMNISCATQRGLNAPSNGKKAHECTK